MWACESVFCVYITVITLDSAAWLEIHQHDYPKFHNSNSNTILIIHVLYFLDTSNDSIMS